MELPQGSLEPNVEYGLTCARYQEVRTRCKALQSRLLLARANMQESNTPWEDALIDEVDVAKSLTDYEDAFSRKCIQEKAVVKAKMSEMAHKLLTSENPPENIVELLETHAYNEISLLEMVTQLREERVKVLEAQGKLFQKLEEYIASLDKDRAKLKETVSSSSDGKNDLQRQVKDIAFMQHFIGHVLAFNNVDFRENETLKAISRSVRNRITSIDNFL